MERGWFESARAARYPTAEAAAKNLGVSPRLIEWLECGSVTAPELAKRIGKALGLTKEQVDAITCQETVARRKAERRMKPDEKIVMAHY